MPRPPRPSSWLTTSWTIWHHQTFDLALSDDITRQQTVDIVLLGRFLERLGDHAVSAARRVVYIVSGFDPTKEPTRDEGTDID